MLDADLVCQRVVTILRELVFVDDNGVVEVAPFNESSLKEGLYLTYKNKGSCRCNFCCEILHVVEKATDWPRFGPIQSCGFDQNSTSRNNDDVLSIVTSHSIFRFKTKNSPIVGLLFHQAYFGDFLEQMACAAVWIGISGPVQFNQAVVDATAYIAAIACRFCCNGTSSSTKTVPRCVSATFSQGSHTG
jgi:hypothetical protein